MNSSPAAKPTPDQTGPKYSFDTSNVVWRDFITPGSYYHLLNVDVDARTVDMLIKFEPDAQCLYHRHVAATTSLVLEGDLHIYDQTAAGVVHKIKPAGTFSSGAVDEIHIEGGGLDGVIVYFGMRGDTDVIYELLDNDLKLKRSITVQDFAEDMARGAP